MSRLPPRLVIAGVASGVGKTTVATGLMAAFAQTGMRVAAAKVGPDYIDPGYHALATGRPGRNLDPWMSGPDAIGPLAARAARSADLLMIEGVMGLFDGARDGEPSSTADVAHLLDAPVLLVVDAAAMSHSIAAVIHGFLSYDERVRPAGVILNRVGSDTHESMLRSALEPLGAPVVGVLRRDDAFVWRHRHLGLVPVAEQRGEVQAAIDKLVGVVRASCDLDAISAIARRAPERNVHDLAAPRRVGHAVVAIPAGPAFGFVYPDNLEALQAAGAELAPFDPTEDDALPDGANALYAAGGFPEVFVQPLSANTPLLDDVRVRLRSGLTTWAECGGLLWLSRSLDGHPMAGVVAAHAHMTRRLTIGYRNATAMCANPIAQAGDVLRGHEFHYSTTEPAGEALELSAAVGVARSGFASPSMLASYLHLHLGASPRLAERFVAAAVDDRAARRALTARD